MSQPPPPPFYSPPVAPVPYAVPEWTPRVIKWFKVYAAGMTLLYVLVIGIGVYFLANADDPPDPDMTPADAQVFGVIMLAMGAALAAAFAAGLFLPRRTWAWVYGIVLIAIGLTSCALWPAAIPLLIFWIKPETRAWFARTA